MKKLRLFDSLKFVVAAIVCTFILNVAHAATLPAGYTELEYIEGTGTQYIDTGITDIVNLKTELVAQLTSINTSTSSYPSLIGANGSSSQEYKVVLGYHYGSSFYSQVGGIAGYKYFGNLDTNKHTFIVDNGTDSQTITMDGTTYTSNYAITTDQTVPLAIFARKTSSSVGAYTNMKVWSVKFWHNGVLIQNLVPAKNSSGVVGMYDLADSNPATAFHTNAGTGEFIAGEWQIKIATTHYNETKFAPVETRLDAAVAAVDTVVTQTMSQAQQIDQIANEKQTRPDEGCTAKYCLLVEDEQGVPHWYPIAGANGVAHNLPNGYTELQYIESTGTQYIDLPTFANAANIDVTVDVVHTDGDNEQIFFAPASSVQFLYTSTNSWRVWRTGKPNKIIATSNDRHLITIKTTSTGCEYYVDGQKNTDVPEDFFNSTELSGKRLSIGARRAENNVGYFWKGKIYSFKAECNGVVCINMVPAKNSSGEIGMLDLADSNPATAFYTNAGTGTFTAGPDM